MGLFRRDVPAAARAVAADAGDRALAAATTASGQHVVAGERALYLPTADGVEAVPYQSIAQVAWDDPVLEVVRAGRPGRVAVTLEDAGELPPAVHERVRSTIAISEHVDLGEGAGATIAARRAPGSGEVTWTVRFDRGLDPRDPDLRARADVAVEELKASTGLG